MREIEFRGKSVGRGDWVFGSLVDKKYIVGEMVEFTEEYFYTDFWCRVNPETVGQYTGLKDKHGVKIYEGDIVKYDNSIHEVVFEQRNNTAYFGLTYSAEETWPFGHYQNLEQIRIIGNKWDDGDLFDS